MNDDKDKPNNTLSDKKDTTLTKIFKNQSKIWPDIKRRSNVFKNPEVGQQAKRQSEIKRKKLFTNLLKTRVISTHYIDKLILYNGKAFVQRSACSFNFSCFFRFQLLQFFYIKYITNNRTKKLLTPYLLLNLQSNDTEGFLHLFFKGILQLYF